MRYKRRSMERRVWFEACPGGGSGYFYDHGDQCPWPTKSMEVAEAWLYHLIRDNDLTPEEIGMVGAEIRAAGLRERADAGELAMLLEHQRVNEFAELLDRLGTLFFG